MTANNVSFTSRINFVDTNTFNRYFRHGTYVDFRKQIPTKEVNRYTQGIIVNPNGKICPFRRDVVKADEIYTDEVRTCPAGVVIDTKTKTAAGFHAYDCIENFEQVEDILCNIFQRVPNPDKAILVGSKNLIGSEYSLPIFGKIYKGLAEKIRNITMFREHTFPYSETDFHYSAKDDTLTIRSMYRPLTDYREFDILSQEEMNKCYREIKIANGDFVTFQKPEL